MQKTLKLKKKNVLLIVTCSKAHLPPFSFNKNINSYVHLPQKLVIRNYSKDVYKRFKISITCAVRE